MTDSMAEMVDRDLAPEDLLAWLYGFTDVDRACFETVATASEPLTVDDVADRVGRERTTVYRSVRRLDEAGLVEREQINYDDGGYYHVYRPVDPDELADEMQRLLTDWYARAGQLVREFRGKYTGDSPSVDEE